MWQEVEDMVAKEEAESQTEGGQEGGRRADSEGGAAAEGGGGALSLGGRLPAAGL